MEPQSGIPAGFPASGFLWAVGIEDTFIPQVRPGLRRLEQYELTQHYRFWKEDLDLVADSGARGLRWGLPWYQVEPHPDRWDWRWTDQVLDYAVNVKNLTVILDLIHYGTPLWLDNSFVNSRYPERAATYAAAVARRYRSLVCHYTPVNEPMVNADRSGRLGEWPPYLKGEDGFVKLTLSIARGAVRTAQAIRAEQPEAVLVQVEATGSTAAAHPDLAHRAAHLDEEQFLGYDLATGRVGEEHPLWPFLLQHGATPAEIDWFHRNAVRFDVFGLNYYPWSSTVLLKRRDGRGLRRVAGGSGSALATIARRVHERYGLPIMITETSARGPAERRARWMDETVTAVGRLRAAGVPICGYTWFPLFAMIDWTYRTGRRPLSTYTLNLGLYEGEFDADGVLARTAIPLVDRFREYTRHMPETAIPVVAGVTRAAPQAPAVAARDRPVDAAPQPSPSSPQIRARRPVPAT